MEDLILFLNNWFSSTGADLIGWAQVGTIIALIVQALKLYVFKDIHPLRLHAYVQGVIAIIMLVAIVLGRFDQLQAAGDFLTPILETLVNVGMNSVAAASVYTVGQKAGAPFFADRPDTA